MEIYSRDFEISSKKDGSPVTEADQLAEKIILEYLASNLPDIPVVAEEATSTGHILKINELFFGGST